MVAPGRPGLYLPVFSFSSKELTTSLPVVSANNYFDVQVPMPEPVPVAREMRCSDWLSQAPLPTLEARQGPPRQTL